MTKIEWTDKTDNPIRVKGGGHWCKKISPGCANCYAETVNNSGFFSFASHLQYTGDAPELELDMDVIKSWSRAKKPARRFVCSMTDMFGEWVPDEWLDIIFAGMALAPTQTFQVLTKRPERMLEYLSHDNPRYTARKIMSDVFDCDLYYPLANVWLGVTVENQRAANERIPLLLQTPAAVRFLSCEPLLEAVNFEVDDGFACCDGGTQNNPCGCHGARLKSSLLSGIDWVIVGGESGSKARPCDIAWIESIVEQCKDAGVPCFVKQLGSNPILGSDSENPIFYSPSKGKGGNPEEWPESIQVREYPQ